MEPASIYLAGPTVFQKQAATHFAEQTQQVRAYGFTPLTPFDSPHKTHQEIFSANCDMIRRCAGAIIDLTPFRGPHADNGTAWEMGALYMLDNKVVVAFSRDQSLLAERFQQNGVIPERDEQGLLIENFGLHDNLMLTNSLSEPQHIYATFGEALAAFAQIHATRTRAARHSAPSATSSTNTGAAL